LKLGQCIVIPLLGRQRPLWVVVRINPDLEL
jgi:hypothetical protein